MDEILRAAPAPARVRVCLCRQGLAVGCPTLDTPADGYQVHQDATSASYLCSVGYVFEDTEVRARSLHCEHGNTWNDTLAPCVNVSLTSAWKKAGVDSWTFSDNNNTKVIMATSDSGDSDTISRIVVPTVIMAMLFLGNAVVLYVLFVLRKRNKKKCSEDEERAAIVKTNGATKETKIDESEIGAEDKTGEITTLPNGAEGALNEDQC
ncbi:CUB and sushi domain-containing protein 3 [Frankliniella fusca]|uniref:CUB and sushi domain-containing protein 3 n=1 Tax=Frankliniella fusca TaxID=407009 RepID=A0AAE1HQB1_9NEOP|nr:CUB and sushi domain-containing protein 3 [Frankliniella fusca]